MSHKQSSKISPGRQPESESDRLTRLCAILLILTHWSRNSSIHWRDLETAPRHIDTGDTYPDAVNEEYLRAVKERDALHYKEAIAILLSMAQKFPAAFQRHWKARHMLGYCQRNEQQFQQALDTQFALIHDLEALSARSLGQTEVLALAHHEMGLNVYQTSNFDYAYDAFARANELLPSSSPVKGIVMNDLIEACLKVGKERKAVGLYWVMLEDDNPTFLEALDDEIKARLNAIQQSLTPLLK
jgi:tetratricopeptide (TPR) repeat protein